MFDDDDPVLAKIRDLALAFPDCQEKVSHGRPVFFTKKIFLYFGGSVKLDGAYVQHGHAILVLPDPEDRHALSEDSRFFSPAYLGPYGWVGLDLDGTTDWTEIQELVDASYRQTAPKRSIAKLDEL